MSTVSRRLLLAALGIVLAVIALGGVEIYLQVTDKTPVVTWGWKDIQWPQERNQLGFRGQSIEYADGDLVVLLVGDSQVQGDTCARDVMPEARLQHHLGRRMSRKVKVFSIGAIGYGQDQELLALEEYFTRYRADAVVTWFTDGNDFWNNTSATHAGGWPPKPTFWLDGQGELRGPSGRFGEPVFSRSKIITKLDQQLNGAFDDAWDRRLPKAYVPMTSFAGEAVTDWKVFTTLPAEMAKERSALSPALVPLSARGTYSNTLTNKLFHRMLGVASARGAKFASLVVERPDFPLADGVYAFDGSDGQRRYVKITREQHWQSVADALRGIDVVRVKVKVEPYCTAADPHLNPAGVDQVMDDLAAELRSRL